MRRETSRKFGCREAKADTRPHSDSNLVTLRRDRRLSRYKVQAVPCYLWRCAICDPRKACYLLLESRSNRKSNEAKAM